MYYVIGTLIVLGVAVLVHELGHFILARRNGVRVEEFCIGFPPRIWSTTRGGTRYSLGVIPVGGFVKMAGDDPESLSGQPDEFFSKSIWIRVKIALAGPTANFVCAYLCVVIYLWTGGIQTPIYEPIFGTPADGPVVYEKYGIDVGDRVIEIAGRKPGRYDEIFKILEEEKTWPVTLVCEGDKGRKTLRLESGAAAELAKIAYPRVDPAIARVFPSSPASRADLMAGDRIAAVNGKPISEWSELHSAISRAPGETLILGVVRESGPVTLTLIPEAHQVQNAQGEVETVGRIGIQSGVKTESQRVAFMESLKIACMMLYEFVLKFLTVLWQLVSGSLSVKMLAGPVGIAQFAGDSLKQGGYPFLEFLGMINANLGFVNLIPLFLITDGGLIFLFLIEAIRRRKMSVKSLERWNILGWAMVLTLLVMATYNDLMIRLRLGEKLARGFDTLKDIF
ncbi:RIP metalloprotease RseP [bacterium]|nr:RIP metalloprotease RseP [bacterium]